MLKRILVPLDGSRLSERALPFAARIARASGGSLVLVQVLSLPVDAQPFPQPYMVQAMIDTELAQADQYLKRISASADLGGVTVDVVALFGSVAPTILAVAEAYCADLIVISSHGHTGVTRWMMGSVAEKLARHSPVSVLILREGGPAPAGPHPDATQPLRVLVPLDGSALAETALEPAASLVSALAAAGMGALHMTRVVTPSTDAMKALGELKLALPEREQLVTQAKMYMQTTLAHLLEGPIAPAVEALKSEITWSVAIDTDVAEAIIRVAENGEDVEGAGAFGRCDLIAMATHGYGGLQRWTMGSVTERVLHATKLPLLIVRPVNLPAKNGANGGKTMAHTQV